MQTDNMLILSGVFAVAVAGVGIVRTIAANKLVSDVCVRSQNFLRQEERTLLTAHDQDHRIASYLKHRSGPYFWKNASLASRHRMSIVLDEDMRSDDSSYIMKSGDQLALYVHPYSGNQGDMGFGKQDIAILLGSFDRLAQYAKEQNIKMQDGVYVINFNRMEIMSEPPPKRGWTPMEEEEPGHIRREI